MVEQSSNSDPLSYDLPDTCDEVFDPDCDEVLLYVEPTGPYVDLLRNNEPIRWCEYRIVAAYHPADTYAPAGTRLRQVLEFLEGSNAITNVQTLATIQVDGYGNRAYAGPREEPTRYELALDAAENALDARGRKSRFPGDCLHNSDMFLALAAHDLIGTDAIWTHEAYHRISGRFAAAFGEPLHPDDDTGLVINA